MRNISFVFVCYKIFVPGSVWVPAFFVGISRNPAPSEAVTVKPKVHGLIYGGAGCPALSGWAQMS